MASSDFLISNLGSFKGHFPHFNEILHGSDLIFQGYVYHIPRW